MRIHISAFSVLSVIDCCLRITSERKYKHAVSFPWIMQTVPPLDSSSWQKAEIFLERKGKTGSLGAFFSHANLHIFEGWLSLVFLNMKNQAVWAIPLVHTSSSGKQFQSFFLDFVLDFRSSSACHLHPSPTYWTFVSTLFKFLNDQTFAFAFQVMTCFLGLIWRLL